MLRELKSSLMSQFRDDYEHHIGIFIASLCLISIMLHPNLYPSPLSSVQSLSCVRLCDTMDCSMPGFPVHHQLLGRTQTHVHCIGDAIQLSHPLSSPSPPALNLSQHMNLFQ